MVFALYPDRDIFGIECKSDGTEKIDFTLKYPNEQLLIEQLGDIEELIIGGYHFSDCVKRVGEMALTMGINTTVDLDLTDLFFNLYKQEEYFDKEKYCPEKYKKYIMERMVRGREREEVALEQFNFVYSSPVYGFNDITPKRKVK